MQKNCSNTPVDDKIQIIQNNPLRIQELPTGTIIDFYLLGEIEDPADYIDFFRAVRDAKQEDTVQLHINCYGGDLTTAFNIIDVLKQSAANINVFVEGNCASAASMIMLAGDNWEINPHSTVMIHAWSGYVIGKWNEQQAQFHFDETWLNNSFKEIYKGFLSDEEIEDVLRGKDLYLNADEVVERLDKYKENDIKKQEIIQNIARKHEDLINQELAKALQQFDNPQTKPKRKTQRKSKN